MMAAKAANLEKQVECPICLEQFKEPKVLSCLHSYCKSCLQKYVTKTSDKQHKITCPECRQETQVPNGDVGKLQANFWVNNFISLLGVVRSGDKAQQQLICEGCDSGDTAVSRCTECSVFVCDLCVKARKRMQILNHHQVVSLKEVKSGGPKALVKPVYCEKHRGETLKLFCQSCDKPICRDCTIVDHQGHKYLFVADAAAKEKKSVKQLLDKTKAKVPILSIGVKAVEEMERRVKAKETAVNKDIDALIDKNIRILEEKRASLKYEAKSIGQAKMKQLEAQREGLMIALASVSNSVESTERALKDGSDVEVLSMKKQLMTNLSKLSSSTWQCEPCQEDTVQLRVNQDVLPVVNIAAVKDIRVEPEVQKCTVSMVGGEPGVMYSTFAGQRREFTVVLRDKHGNQINDDDVEVDVSVAPIKYLVRETIEIHVIHERGGFYNFNFQPQEQGIYEVTVIVSGKHVAGSPYQWPVVGLGGRYVKPTARIMSFLGTTRNRDVLSWKVKYLVGGETSQLGVSTPEGRSLVVSAAGRRFRPDRPYGEVSNIDSWQAGDVFVLFLNMGTKKLNIRNLRTSETEFFVGVQGNVSPYLYPDDPEYFSLDV